MTFHRAKTTMAHRAFVSFLSLLIFQSSMGLNAYADCSTNLSIPLSTEASRTLNDSCKVEMELANCRDFKSMGPDLTPYMRDCSNEKNNQVSVSELVSVCGESVGASWKDSLSALLQIPGQVVDLWTLMVAATKKNLAEKKRLIAACDADPKCKVSIARALPLYKKLPEQQIQKISSAQLIEELQYEMQQRRQIKTEAKVLDQSAQINMGKFVSKRAEDKSACLSPKGKMILECYAIAQVIDPLLVAGVVGKAPKLFEALGVAMRTAEKGSVALKVESGASKISKARQAMKDFGGANSERMKKFFSRFKSAGGDETKLAEGMADVPSETRTHFAKVADNLNENEVKRFADDLRHCLGGVASNHSVLFITSTLLSFSTTQAYASGDGACELGVVNGAIKTAESRKSGAIKASMSQTATFNRLEKYEKESRLKVFDLRDRALNEVTSGEAKLSKMTPAQKREFMKTIKGLSEITRVTGESAASVGDLVSARSLTKEALASMDRVLKDAPELLNTSRDRGNILDLRIRAGDIDGAAKQLEKNGNLDFRAEGFSTATDALKNSFTDLLHQAKAGPSKSILENEKGNGRYILTGQPIPVTNASSAYLNQINELRTLDKIMESKPTWLDNFDYARERASVQSLLENAKRELQRRGYDVNQLLKEDTAGDSL